MLVFVGKQLLRQRVLQPQLRPEQLLQRQQPQVRREQRVYGAVLGCVVHHIWVSAGMAWTIVEERSWCVRREMRGRCICTIVADTLVIISSFYDDVSIYQYTLDDQTLLQRNRSTRG